MKSVLPIIGAVLVAALSIPALSHNGYEGIQNAMGGECCGNEDCRPANEGEVTESAGKVYWHGVEVDPGQLGPAPGGYDVQYHVCQSHGHLYCILRAMGF